MNHGQIINKGTPSEVLKDASELEKHNLDVPFQVKLIEALNKLGYNIKEDASLEEIGDKVCR